MLQRHPAIQKIGFTLLISSIYILGMHITVPGVDQNDIKINNFLVQASRLTAGNFRTINLFTLGIGPYMSSMILFRLFSVQKMISADKMTERQMYGLRMGMTLVIGIIQCLNIMLSVNTVSISGIDDRLVKFIFFLTLMTGLCFLIWLTSMNTAYGLGGMSVIIIVNIMLDVLRQLASLLLIGQYILLGIILLLLVIIIAVFVIMDKAVVRIPLNRINISSDYADKTYLPIKLNPSGGMSIMYALTIFALPQYLLLIFEHLWKDNTTIKWIATNITMTTGYGLTLYIILIFSLTVGFSLFTINPENIAERLQKSGDYIEGFRPGKETEQYIYQVVVRVSMVGATFLTVLSAGPLAYGVLSGTVSSLYYLPGSFAFIVGLLLNMQEELKGIFIMRQYKSVLDTILE